MKEAYPGNFISGMCQDVSFAYINPETDFALLKVDWDANREKDHLRGRTGFPFLTVSDRELNEGEPVYAFGYPLPSPVMFTPTAGHSGHSPRVTSAIVTSTLERSAFVSSPQDAKVYVLDKALNYGNSGGPILSTATGKVHALCSRFQPVSVPQNHIRYGNQPLQIVIPSLYGVVSSLANGEILNQLQSRGIAVMSD